jgi:hypothetical protein
MAFRPAQIWTGSIWDDVGDKRLTTHTHAGGANGVNIAQSSVTGLTAELGSKVDYALPTNAQTGTTYTFVLADGNKLTTASNASAVTLTIPPQSSVAWPADAIIRVVNYGAGALTIAGGSGVTVTNTATTLAQFQSAAAIRTAENAWTLAPFGGGTSSASALTFNSSTTTVVPAGCKNARMVIVGGGRSGVSAASGTDVARPCGGFGGVVNSSLQSVTPGETLTITVGSTATASSVVGSFGTLSAAGGTGTTGLGENGTNVAGFGSFAARGCGLIRGGPNGYSWAVGAGSPGGGRPTGGANNFGSMNAVANTGSGGSQGTSGASGVVVIQFF